MSDLNVPPGLPGIPEFRDQVIGGELAAVEAGDYGVAAAHSLYAESIDWTNVLPPTSDPWWQS